jgi:hypothetical protein
VKRTVFLLAIATLVLISSQPVIGQAGRERNNVLNEAGYTERVLNECTGESVLIRGHLRIWNHVVRTPSGKYHFKGQTTLHGKGFGSEQQEYIFNYVGNHRGSLPDTTTINLTLVNQGGGSDFRVKSIVHTKANGKISFKIVSSTC